MRCRHDGIWRLNNVAISATIADGLSKAAAQGRLGAAKDR
jgi:hypothetical protein